MQPARDDDGVTRMPVRRAAPRFDLRFAAGGGVLRLAHPLGFPLGELAALEISLGRIRFPLSMRAGLERFRTRRTRVRRAVVTVDLEALGRAAAARGVDLRVGAGPAPGRVTIRLRDAAGLVVGAARLSPEGPDLLILLESVRAAVDGAEPPRARLLRAGLGLGLELDEARGALRLRRPLRAALAEALVPLGWRVPDDGRAELELPVVSEASVALVLASGPAKGDDDEALGRLAALDRARRLAPVLRELALGRVDAAVDRAAALAVRDPDARALRDELAFDRSLAPPAEAPGDPDEARCAALRGCLRAADADAAFAAARRLAEHEEEAELVADGVTAVTERFGRQRPAAACELLSRAASRAPTDGALLARWARLAALCSSPGELERAAEFASSAPVEAELRARVLARAALAGDAGARRARTERAFSLCPDEPEVGRALAEVLVSEGASAQAVERLDRAFEGLLARGDADRALEAARRAAALLEALGRPAAAGDRLARALEAAPPSAEVISDLARLRLAHGDEAAAAEAWGRVLAADLDAAIAPPLRAAAQHHLERGDAAAAAPFVDRLARLGGHDDLVSAHARAVADAYVSDPARLVGADEDLLLRVAAAASSPDEVVRALVRALELEDRPTAIARAAVAAARRGPDELFKRVASAVVRLLRLPDDPDLVGELIEHAPNEVVLDVLRAHRTRLGRGSP